MEVTWSWLVNLKVAVTRSLPPPTTTFRCNKRAILSNFRNFACTNQYKIYVQREVCNHRLILEHHIHHIRIDCIVHTRLHPSQYYHRMILLVGWNLNQHNFPFDFVCLGEIAGGLTTTDKNWCCLVLCGWRGVDERNSDCLFTTWRSRKHKFKYDHNTSNMVP